MQPLTTLEHSERQVLKEALPVSHWLQPIVITEIGVGKIKSFDIVMVKSRYKDYKLTMN